MGFKYLFLQKQTFVDSEIKIYLELNLTDKSQLSEKN